MKKKSKLFFGALGFVVIIALSMVVAFYIAKANLEKDFRPVSSGELIFTLEFASEKENEDSVQTKVDLSFYDDNTCHIEGSISSLYDFSYTTGWQAEGSLIIDDIQPVVAECTDEQAIAFVQLLTLPLSFDMNMQHSISQSGNSFVIDIEGIDLESGESLTQLTFGLSEENAAKLGLD